MSELTNDPRPWVQFDPLTQTYGTRDGTKVAGELVNGVECLADVIHIAALRDQQRATGTKP